MATHLIAMFTGGDYIQTARRGIQHEYGGHSYGQNDAKGFARHLHVLINRSLRLVRRSSPSSNSLNASTASKSPNS
jgi:hypothetical protein